MSPCDTCGGSGKSDEWSRHDPPLQYSCVRCVNMPKLDSRQYPTIARVTSDGWFKPDPDSIMRWCFGHDSPSYGTRFKMTVDWCDYAQALLTVCESDEDRTAVGECSFGWILPPTRLETFDDS